MERSQKGSETEGQRQPRTDLLEIRRFMEQQVRTPSSWRKV
ncbi:hypothetical protein [Paenibacillus luteus]|nr:hypothetical protein [Paenibacillus luteus]